MVENSSIHSEDIDVDSTSHLPRPCAFIAPPPPLEPPPDDSEPVDYNMIINGRVDTVDVGVETSDDSNSYGPVSTRSSTDSPVSSKYLITACLSRPCSYNHTIYSLGRVAVTIPSINHTIYQ